MYCLLSNNSFNNCGSISIYTALSIFHSNSIKPLCHKPPYIPHTYISFYMARDLWGPAAREKVRPLTLTTASMIVIMADVAVVVTA